MSLDEMTEEGKTVELVFVGKLVYGRVRQFEIQFYLMYSVAVDITECSRIGVALYCFRQVLRGDA